MIAVTGKSDNCQLLEILISCVIWDTEREKIDSIQFVINKRNRHPELMPE